MFSSIGKFVKGITFEKKSVLALASASLIYYDYNKQSQTNLPPFFNVSFCDYEMDKYSSIPITRNFVADVVETVSPAVVNIICTSNNFLGAVSSGSGFIINSDGFIVTNAHVVAPSSDGKVVVTMKNGEKKQATIHSLDTISDIALVKLDEIDDLLPTVPFGVSSRVRSGEFVIAIGSPMHLQNSASFGIVSATVRHASELGLSKNRSEYIQTDAAINVGNSGGPLVNLDGEVIGINTMKVKDTDGISFAIPIDIASQIISQLISTKRVVRPYVGLKLANVSSSKNKRKSLTSVEETQVVILDVTRGSPAYNAGLASGDIIREINGKPVKSVREIFNEIGITVGKMVELKVNRKGQEFIFSFHTAPENVKH